METLRARLARHGIDPARFGTGEAKRLEDLANELTSGFQAVQERAIGYAKENAEASFALASDLAAAKDVQQVLTLQTQFAQAQIQAYAAQAQDLGKMMTEAMQGGMSPRR